MNSTWKNISPEKSWSSWEKIQSRACKNQRKFNKKNECFTPELNRDIWHFIVQSPDMMNQLWMDGSRRRVQSPIERVQTMALVPRRPTPRANCSSRPEIAPEGLGAEDLRPTVEL